MTTQPTGNVLETKIGEPLETGLCFIDLVIDDTTARGVCNGIVRFCPECVGEPARVVAYRREKQASRATVPATTQAVTVAIELAEWLGVEAFSA